MSERTNVTASSVRRTHEHSAQSDSAEQERERAMMTETAKYAVDQHVHVTSDLGDSSDRPGTVSSVYVPDDNRDSETFYAVTFNDGDEFVFAEHELSSCDLVEALSAELQRIRAEQSDDHGPGCDGPYNCTCDPADPVNVDAAECARKLSEFDAVRSSLDTVISALINARDELRSWEIDDYTDSDAICCSEAFELIHSSAAALIASVADSAHVVDVADAAKDSAARDAASLRSGMILIPAFPAVAR